MAKGTPRFERFNVRRRSRRGRIILIVVVVLLSAAVVWLYRRPLVTPVMATGKAKPQDVQVVDENYEKLQRCRAINRELLDRQVRAEKFMEDGGGVAGATKLLKGESEE
jgi:hypothetical protein